MEYDEQLKQTLQSTYNFNLFVNVFYDTQPINNNLRVKAVEEEYLCLIQMRIH